LSITTVARQADARSFDLAADGIGILASALFGFVFEF